MIEFLNKKINNNSAEHSEVNSLFKKLKLHNIITTLLSFKKG